MLEGEGRAEVEGVPHELRPGRLLFIPAGARHRTTNTGSAPLRCLFVFPTDSFEEVVYHFDERKARRRCSAAKRGLQPLVLDPVPEVRRPQRHQPQPGHREARRRGEHELRQR